MAEEQAANQNLTIQKIYTKDISFESPNSPLAFQEEWKPEINVELNTDGRDLDEHNIEVIIKVTVTAKNNSKNSFLVEVQQAGIFQLSGFDDETRAYLIGSYCPGTLFPYAREVISRLVTDGGFPPQLLAPVNFEALYQEQAQKNQAQNGDAEQTH